jgi:ferric-dicitrate binding protein FerR (iron transport regulator)
MSPMDETRFRALLDAYGGDPRRWPDAERAAALAFAAAHPASEALLEAAQTLDAALDLGDRPAPSDLLARRILASAPQRQVRTLRFAYGGLAAALCIGVLLGFGGMRAISEGREAEALFTAAFDGPIALDGPGADG